MASNATTSSEATKPKDSVHVDTAEVASTLSGGDSVATTKGENSGDADKPKKDLKDTKTGKAIEGVAAVLGLPKILGGK